MAISSELLIFLVISTFSFSFFCAALIRMACLIRYPTIMTTLSTIQHFEHDLPNNTLPVAIATEVTPIGIIEI